MGLGKLQANAEGQVAHSVLKRKVPLLSWGRFIWGWPGNKAREPHRRVRRPPFGSSSWDNNFRVAQSQFLAFSGSLLPCALLAEIHCHCLVHVPSPLTAHTRTGGFSLQAPVTLCPRAFSVGRVTPLKRESLRERQCSHPSATPSCPQNPCSSSFPL